MPSGKAGAVHSDEIRMQFFQQTADLEDPELNLCIGDFVLNADKDLEPGERLQRGAELLIQWSMDDNGLLDLSVEAPDLGRVIDGRNLYVPEAHHRNYEGPRGAEMASVLHKQAEGDLEDARETLDDAAQEELAELGRRVERCYSALAGSTEADVHRSVSEEARKIRQDVALLLKLPQHRSASVSHQLDEVEDGFPIRYATAVEADRFDRLTATARRAARSGDFDEASRAISEAETIAAQARRRDPDFIAAVFMHFARAPQLAKDPLRHAALCEEGLAALEGDDLEALTAVVFQMARNANLPGGNTSDIGALADLLRA